jgi:hypothetical protein
MTTITRHPLFEEADALKRAFLLNGFTLRDNGMARELVPKDTVLSLFPLPQEAEYAPVRTGDSSYVLRTSLLPVLLPQWRQELPLRALAAGRVYDGKESGHPEREVLEGVIADEGLRLRDLQTLWDRIIKDARGLEARGELEALEQGTCRIVLKEKDGRTLPLGYMGPAAWTGRALLGLADSKAAVWLFRLELDTLTAADYELESREDVYAVSFPWLTRVEDCRPAAGGGDLGLARDVLRSLGYTEFTGERFYSADAYIRMNMIQEAWDVNNAGIPLAAPLPYENPLTPLKQRTGLPTVLTPALEQAMSELAGQGIEAAKIFEIGHIFLPGREGAAPVEKIAVSFGAYARDMNLKAFREEVSRFLDGFGVRNHFYIPTDRAIAYRADECLLVMDEKMHYLGANFGHIAPKALANFKINSEAYMAQFELEPLAAKAREEYAFTPPELG